jgi:hypothetical protein
LITNTCPIERGPDATVVGDDVTGVVVADGEEPGDEDELEDEALGEDEEQAASATAHTARQMAVLIRAACPRWCPRSRHG